MREPGFAGSSQLSPLRRDEIGGCRVGLLSRDRDYALAIPQTITLGATDANRNNTRALQNGKVL